jgi:hypothetical protein
VVLYRRFGTTYHSHIQGSRSPRRKVSSWTPGPLNMEPIGCPETSIQNHHSMMHSIPEERKSHLHRRRKPEIKHSYGTCFCSQNCLLQNPSTLRNITTAIPSFLRLKTLAEKQTHLTHYALILFLEHNVKYVPGWRIPYSD